uniref:Uncharacterized protein n=1 Tax=Arundo donax TaxID=35708 RepID=A0A0A9F1E1_ARUDO
MAAAAILLHGPLSLHPIQRHAPAHRPPPLSSQPLRSADNAVRHAHAEQGNKQAGWRMEMHRPLPGCCRRCCESSKRYERMGHMSFPMSVVLFCFHFFPNKR